MEPIRTEMSNFVYGAGDLEGVMDLPCEREVDGSGNQTGIYCVWEPTEEERAMLFAGANLKMGFMWPLAIPPVILMVTDEAKVG